MVMTNRDEQQRAGAAMLLLHVQDGGYPRDFAAYPQRFDELQAAAGPHAVAVFRRRQETTPGRMAVSAQAGLEHRVLEKSPVPQRRQRLTVGRRRLAEGGSDALDQVAAQLVMGFFASADPGRQVD